MTKTQEALKLALEGLENAEYGDYDKKELNEAITAIREALEQPAQQQEPVAICEYCEKERPVIQAEGKPWVALTDGQSGQPLDDPSSAEPHQGHWRVLPFAFARAIEAKLREKNA